MMKRMVLLDWNAMKCFHPRILLLPVISLAAGFISLSLHGGEKDYFLF